jgi:cation diffusion facilitator family transporter
MINAQNQHSQKALLWAAIGSSGLFFIKFIAFWISGSLVALGSAFDSLGDTAVSLINRKVNSLSQEAPDSQHPFGHGGFEVIGALIQGVLLATLGINLIIEALRRRGGDGDSLLHPGEFKLAAGILFFSAIAGAVISYMLGRAEKQNLKDNTRSLALHSDRAHYATDFFTNLLSAIGLMVMSYTGLHWIDPVLGSVAGGLTILAAIPILKKCYEDIMHQQVSTSEQQSIVDIVFASNPKIEGVHQLRSRRLGPHLFVDFHMKLAATMALEEAHEIGDTVIRELKHQFPSVDVIVHLDPDSEPDQMNWSPS